MVRAASDEAVYEDCTNVVLYNNSSGTKREKVGVYCWLGSSDCYIFSCLELQVDTLPATIQEDPLRMTEPGVYQISDLFKAADVVAMVKILSGDTENYDHAVYKGEVIKGFKGVPSKATVYFGPFVGERLGWEYLLFLRNAGKPVAPKTTASASYGTIQYSEIFNQGYSSMESSYECVFDGKEIAQKCDYGVRVCTDYIKLPQSISVFAKENDPPFGCRWARKAALVSLLDILAVPKK